MADDDSSSGGFRRERNLSNRNFNKPGSSRRRVSTDSHSSSESKSLNTSPTKDDSQKTVEIKDNDPVPLTLDCSETTYFNSPSVSSDRVPLIGTSADDTLHARSEIKTLQLETDDLSLTLANSEGQSTLHGRSELKTEFNDAMDSEEYRNAFGVSGGSFKKPVAKRTATLSPQSSSSPHTPDPALMDVKQKLIMFEKLKHGMPSTSKYMSKSAQSLLESDRATSSSPPLPSSSKLRLVHAYPKIGSDSPVRKWKNTSIEEHSEDEVESLKDEVVDDPKSESQTDKDEADTSSSAVDDDFGTSSSAGISELQEDEVPVVAVNREFLTLPSLPHSRSQEGKSISPDQMRSPLEETLGMDTTTEATAQATQKPKNKDFPRNFRSRPRTEVIEASSEPSLTEPGRCHSVHSKQNSA